MVCRSRCTNPRYVSDYSIKPSYSGGRGRYLEGRKRCIVCGITLAYEGIRCPCCSQILRTRPHDGHKHKWNEKRGIVRY